MNDDRLDKVLNDWHLPERDLSALAQRIVLQCQGMAQKMREETLMQLLSRLMGLRLTPSAMFAPAGGLAALAFAGFLLGSQMNLAASSLLEPEFYTAAPTIEDVL